MDCLTVTHDLVDWLKKKNEKAKTKGFVVGVSGGVDSALVSTLCAITELPVYLVQLPINRKLGEISNRADEHCKMLASKFKNVNVYKHDLSEPFNEFSESICTIKPTELALANLRSRLRMCSLYTFANTFGCLVAGTGNKVEDYGVGFFTKYGDGGVDISPIGDLFKSEVRELSSFLGIDEKIVKAVPTDELWADTRSDEEQIGATYDELEWVMKAIENSDDGWNDVVNPTERQKQVLSIYLKRHDANAHKMTMPKVCELKNKF